VNFFSFVPYFFLKSPLFRTLVYLCVIALVCLGAFFISVSSRVPPEIYSINPPITRAGETLTIDGTGFGSSRGTSVVSIGNGNITAARYLSWSDTRITLSLPPNVADGLVTVETSKGISAPKIFTNAENIPVAVRVDWTASVPVISGLDAAQAYPGLSITITGANFGVLRGSSQVLFAAPYPMAPDARGEIPAIPADTYDFWNDSEIRLRVPDGAASGPLRVKTGKGTSNFFHITVASPVGVKVFADRRIYVLRFDTDVSNAQVREGASLIIRMPRPLQSAPQPQAELEDCSPPPMIADFNNMLVHQIQLDGLGDKKIFFSHSFVVRVYAQRTEIDPLRVIPYTAATRALFAPELAPDPLVKSDAPELTDLAGRIVQREANPWQQARLLYDYMIAAWQVLPELRPGESDVLYLLKEGLGDAYDFALVYCALLRAVGIPAVPVAGIVVTPDRVARSHWWVEFYLERYGWVPADVGRRSFGSLEADHVAFSRGWKQVKSAIPNSHIVFRPRTYAFQSIWEESSAGAEQYSSFWNDPVVTGIY
jgi:hypothetical protein